MNRANKKAFTMIELIFVVVIISIIAAISIPKLTATKDDALGVSVKNDISNTTTAVVSAYNSTDNFNDISKAILLDEGRWKQGINTSGNDNLAYVFTTRENGRECVRMEIDDSNSSQAFQVLVASSLRGISGNDSKVCSKIRYMYSKVSENRKDNLIGESVHDSVIQYLSILYIRLDSDGLSW